MKNKCTILVCSCDAYSDLWEPFFKLFREYWPDCKFDIVLNTESKICPDYGVHVTQYPDKRMLSWPYGKRLRYHLSKIKTPYTMILLDDFFLRKSVETDRIAKVINWLDQDKRAVVFSFQNVPDANNTTSKKYPGFSKRPANGPYKFNFQAAIWRTKQLKSFWKNHESPWQWEVIGNRRSGYKCCTKKYDFYVLEDDNVTPVNYGFIQGGIWGIFRNKWVQDVVDLFENHNISVDYSSRGFYTQENDKTKYTTFSKWDRIKSWGVFHYLTYKADPWLIELKWLVRVIKKKLNEYGLIVTICQAVKRILRMKQ